MSTNWASDVRVFDPPALQGTRFRWCPVCGHDAVARHDVFGCQLAACGCSFDMASIDPDAWSETGRREAVQSAGQPPTLTGAPCRSATLTACELDILRRVAAGGTNARIARDLGRHEDTVKTHIRRLSRKLGAHNRGHAVALGYDLGHLP